MSLTCQNDHPRGDQWNGEDLSIWSPSDTHHLHLKHSTSSTPETTLVEQPNSSQSAGRQFRSSSSDGSADSADALMKTKNYIETNVEQPTMAFSFPFNASLNSGSRAFEAFVRPAPIVLAGRPSAYGFDMRTCTFSMSMVPFQYDCPEDAPTEVFVPEYFFQDCEPEIVASSGRWVMYRPAQILRWWHSGAEEQTLKISSAYKREGVVGTNERDIEGWYYWNDSCSIM